MKKFLVVILFSFMFLESNAISVAYSVEPFSGVKRYVELTETSVMLYGNSTLSSFPINNDNMITNGCGPKTASNAILYLTGQNFFSQEELGNMMNTGAIGTLPAKFASSMREAFGEISGFSHNFQFPAYGFWASSVDNDSGDFRDYSSGQNSYYWANGGEKTYQYYVLEQLLRGYPVPVLLTKCTYDGGCGNLADLGTLHYVLIRGVDITGNFFSNSEINIETVHIIDNSTETYVEWTTFKKALQFDKFGNTLRFFDWLTHYKDNAFVKPFIMGRIISKNNPIGEEYEKNANGITESFQNIKNLDFFDYYESDFIGGFWRKVQNPDNSMVDIVEYSFGNTTKDPLTYSSKPKSGCENSNNSFVSIGYTGWDFKDRDCVDDKVTCLDIMKSYEEAENENYYAISYETINYYHENCGKLYIAAAANRCPSRVIKNDLINRLQSIEIATCRKCKVSGKNRCRSFKNGNFIFSTKPNFRRTKEYCKKTDFKAELSDNTSGLKCQWHVNNNLEKEENCSGENTLQWPFAGEEWLVGYKVEMKVLFSQTGKIIDSVIWENNQNRDGDEFPDSCDYCPDDPSEENIDFCNDDDDDGVPNAYDNCPNDPNPYVWARGEIIFGLGSPGQTTNVGAFYHENTKDNIVPHGNGFYWQPDHNLSGKGDACDPDTRYSKVLFDRSFVSKGSDPLLRNEYLQIDMKMFAGGEDVFDARKQTIRYCSLPEVDSRLWGTEGFCTRTDEKKEQGFIYDTYSKENFPHKVADYGFSHGSEPKPVDDEGNDSWKELDWQTNPSCFTLSGSQQLMMNMESTIFLPPGEFFRVCPERDFPSANTESYSSIYWNWRSDFYDNFGHDYFSELYPEESGVSVPEGHYISHFKYTLSAGVKGVADGYIMNDPFPPFSQNINSSHFYNQEKYTRSARYYDRAVGYYKWLPLSIPEVERMQYFDEWLRQLLLKELIIYPWESDDFVFKWTGSWKDNIRNIPVRMEQFFGALEEKHGFLYGLSKVPGDDKAYLKFTYIENSSDWLDSYTFTGVPTHLEPAGLSIPDENIFVLMVNPASNSYSLYNTAAGVFEEVGGLPEDVENMTFIEQGDNIFIAGNYGDYIEMFEISQTPSGGYSVTHIDSGIKPSSRTLFNIYSDETGIYLAGGGNTDGQTIEVKRDVWKFEKETGWQIIKGDTGKDLFKLMIRKTENILLLVSQTGLNGNNAAYITLDVNTGEIVEEGFVAVKGPGYYAVNENLCKYMDANVFWSGFESAGYCSRFIAPDYGYFNAGIKINAVDGVGKYLFAAHNSGIRIYDISDPVSPEYKSNFVLYGPVKDLIVNGELIFAATGNGISILRLTHSGLVLKKHIATYGDSAVIKQFGDYFIIGDGQGLKKLSLSTLEITQSVNTSGDVSTLVIVDGIIHLYDWAGLKRYNVDSFQRITTSSSYRSNPKLAVTEDKKIIVSYGGKVYQLTYNGNTPVYTEKSGDPAEVQKGYAFNSYAYFPKGNGIKISAGSIALPVCGNGIKEYGETCDGDTVPCTTLGSNYTGGYATCNSECSGYNTVNCQVCDGWGC